jgi:hypothetical protein
MRSLAVLGIGSFIFFVSLLAAQSLKSHLTVTVEDSSGAPIPDAAVQVQHWAGGSGRKSQLVQDGLQTTDAQGRATFEVPEYQYEVLASAKAFAPAVTSVEVYGGHEFSRVFKLSVRTSGGVKVEAITKSQ